jgi:hypothetical protein
MDCSYSGNSKVCTTLATTASNVKDWTLSDANPVYKGMRLTSKFIVENWSTIIALGVAWGIIIAGIGAMHGFDAVALPFTIGIGVGCGFGLVTGYLTVTVLDPDNKRSRYNTLWNLINEGIFQLEAHGTRMILLSIAVTVLLWAAVSLPKPIGFFCGLLIGNQFATGAGFVETPPKNPWVSYERRVDVIEGALLDRGMLKVPLGQEPYKANERS